MKLVIDMATVAEKVTLDELIQLEAGGMPAQQMKVILSRFAVGEDEQPLPEGQAMRQLGSFPLGELRKGVVALTKAIQELLGSAVPPQTSGS